LITLEAHALNQKIQPSLNNRHTNWDDFRQLINERLTLNVSLKTEEDIEAAVKFFNDTIQWAGWNAMPEHTDTVKTYDSVEICISYEHQKAKDYLTQQHMNSSNSTIITKMIAFKHSCKVLHQQNPLTIPCGRQLNK
jgi:hypothetical protein